MLSRESTPILDFGGVLRAFRFRLVLRDLETDLLGSASSKHSFAETFLGTPEPSWFISNKRSLPEIRKDSRDGKIAQAKRAKRNSRGMSIG
jgi:hypothetical protein